jgi:casein kinase II subunit beta
MSAVASRLPSRVIEYDGFFLNIKPYHFCPMGTIPWIRQFCQQRRNSWYIRIDAEYLRDSFNSYGFNKYLPNFHLAREMICDNHSREWRFLTDRAAIEIHEQAKQLYGLIHSRWICTTPGLNLMKVKSIKKRRFGTCPRLYCNRTPLLPVGLSPFPNRHSAKLFCPQCADVYKPPPDKVFDGAHFGPAFPSVFLVNFPKHDGRRDFTNGRRTIFGFRIFRERDRLEIGPHASNRHKDEDELIPRDPELAPPADAEVVVGDVPSESSDSEYESDSS